MIAATWRLFWWSGPRWVWPRASARERPPSASRPFAGALRGEALL